MRALSMLFAIAFVFLLAAGLCLLKWLGAGFALALGDTEGAEEILGREM